MSREDQPASGDGSSPSPETKQLAVIGRALHSLRQQFEEAYLDDHKLIVDTNEYDQSYLKDLTPEQLRQLELRPHERRELEEEKWARRQRHRKGKWLKDDQGNPINPTPVAKKDEPDMCVDPSEFPRILDLIRAKWHLDAAEKSFHAAFDTTTPFTRRRQLLDMLGHLNDLDRSLGYTQTDPDSGEKIMKGPVIEYKMDGKIIAGALTEISHALSELGIKNQLANELRDDELFKQFLR